MTFCEMKELVQKEMFSSCRLAKYPNTHVHAFFVILYIPHHVMTPIFTVYPQCAIHPAGRYSQFSVFPSINIRYQIFTVGKRRGGEVSTLQPPYYKTGHQPPYLLSVGY